MINEENLVEEVFCLNYELNTLANLVLRSSSERWVPGFLHERVEYSHSDRYKLACQYSTNKNVIDVACGIGKGSYMMATNGQAKQVSGYDIQPEAIRYAKHRNAAPNVDFTVSDAQELGIDNKFDMAVSFETVEHLPDFKAFLMSVKNCLKPDGLFLISTPISTLPVDNKPANPYHVQEWGFIEFQDVLKDFFTIEKIYVQLYPVVTAPSYKKHTLARRAFNKIKRTLFKLRAEEKPANSVQVSPFSKIEEYLNQYPVSELGYPRVGYQIVLAKRND